jgi:hypothetical protein
VAKKRKSSSAAKGKKKTARPKRRASAKKAVKGVDFNPVKRQLSAHIAKLEKMYGAGAPGADEKQQATVVRLRALQDELSRLCVPTMILETP